MSGAKQWYTVDAPWGNGTLIVEGDEDPHKGKFVADCESIAFSGDDPKGYYGGTGDPAATAALIVAEHNATVDGESDEARAQRWRFEELALKHSRLMAAWTDTSRALLRLEGVAPEKLPNKIAEILVMMRDYDAPPKGAYGDEWTVPVIDAACEVRVANE